ncbi:F-box protein At5g07610-like [Typha angustifolia]|uniref:F-box protein At5g07610-like n=1 Tax=Typha angustifolia TaxID=59011 RepID=UPI003C2E1F3C
MSDRRKMKCATARPHLNDDIMFRILSCLPAKSLLRFKTVCQSWDKLIADPFFARRHSCLPASFSGVFIRWFLNPGPESLKPLLGNAAGISTTTSRLFSRGFSVVASSNGLVCLYRHSDEALLVGNPATSQWSVLPKHDVSRRSYDFSHGYVLMFEPAKSLHYKLIYIMVRIKDEIPHDNDGHVDDGDDNDGIRFYIFSSEMSSWRASSGFALAWGDACLFYSDRYQFLNIGGGAICWYDLEYELVFGYEVDTDKLWSTKVPPDKGGDFYGNMVGSGGSVYFIIDKECKMSCWRLEGKNWVLEREASKDYPKNCYPILAYDSTQDLVILQDEDSPGDLLAYHFPSTTCRVACPTLRDAPVCGVFPYTITLAPFHAGETDTQNVIQTFLSD